MGLPKGMFPELPFSLDPFLLLQQAQFKLAVTPLRSEPPVGRAEARRRF
jgi:hypothetical protein